MTKCLTQSYAEYITITNQETLAVIFLSPQIDWAGWWKRRRGIGWYSIRGSGDGVNWIKSTFVIANQNRYTSVCYSEDFGTGNSVIYSKFFHITLKSVWRPSHPNVYRIYRYNDHKILAFMFLSTQLVVVCRQGDNRSLPLFRSSDLCASRHCCVRRARWP